MLHGLLKISFLISCLLIHDIEAGETVWCTGSFSPLDEDSSDCLSLIPKRQTYSCKPSSCQVDYHQWVQWYPCQLTNSNDKGVSTQQCVKYSWIKPIFTCYNPNNTPYTCKYTPQTAPPMVCTDCTETTPGIA
ncbi:uncharacterized protein MELLADRAFT_123568 [Melampsora larici-populina 98AG31]|uniref:Secreted protein n=1 Tax=Melampsora larici-populina (strain 98AG31 / pathotype 3-4-7) TaxID=747676 RepID=F4SCI5_MELLP|nr:uncharacterized protein MELLADRAFT_123568 [Melampsora larici-populina 98AG31]EGF97642.1 secreted protein [Melampsora larici-populina 98AG31]